MSESILDDNKTASATELAVLFSARSAETKAGPRYVTARMLTDAYTNRARTGMPEAEPERRRGGGPACRVWNVQRAWVWFRDYVPSRGGAPVGNRNAVRHGNYVGLRAEKELRRTA